MIGLDTLLDTLEKGCRTYGRTCVRRKQQSHTLLVSPPMNPLELRVSRDFYAIILKVLIRIWLLLTDDTDYF